jgi:hypothetical protein
MNALVVSLLEESLGLAPTPRNRRDLSNICGSWSEEEFREFERNTAVFEQVDGEIWERE